MNQPQHPEMTRELVVDHLSVVLEKQDFLSIVTGNQGPMELPVNNYLKTPGEIELEFKYGINPRSLNLKRDGHGSFTSITKTDGYLNIHDLDTAMLGFMEENY